MDLSEKYMSGTWNHKTKRLLMHTVKKDKKVTNVNTKHTTDDAPNVC